MRAYSPLVYTKEICGCFAAFLTNAIRRQLLLTLQARFVLPVGLEIFTKIAQLRERSKVHSGVRHGKLFLSGLSTVQMKCLIEVALLVLLKIGKVPAGAN